MKKLTYCLALLLLAGCTTTYKLGHDPRNVAAENALSEMIDEECALTLLDGSEDEGRLVKWTKDTLVFLKDKHWMSIPTDQIYCVKETGSRVLGTIAGFSLGGRIGGIGDEHQLVQEGALVGGLVGAVIGNRVLANRTIVTFAAPPDAVGLNGSPPVIGVLIPALTGETDSYLIFSSGGKTIMLPKARIRFERREDGIMIWATRSTFQSAGLIIR